MQIEHSRTQLSRLEQEEAQWMEALSKAATKNKDLLNLQKPAKPKETSASKVSP